MRDLLVVLLIVGSTHVVVTAADGQETAKPYRQPELVAITWQGSAAAEAPRPLLWRPDGSVIDSAESDWLERHFETFSVAGWHPSRQLRPVVLIFRVDERSTARQIVTGSIVANRGQPRGGSQAIAHVAAHMSTELHLAKTGFVASKKDLGSWPGDFDLKIRYPIAEPELVKTIKPVTEEAVQIDTGVRWYIDRALGRTADRKQTGLPAAVLEIDRRIFDPGTNFTSEVRLKDGRSLYTDSIRFSPPQGSLELYISEAIEDLDRIDRVEITRLRHATATLEHVPLRVDLLPPDVQPASSFAESPKGTVTSRQFKSIIGAELDPAGGIDVGTGYSLQIRFKTPRNSVDEPGHLVAQITSLREGMSVLMDSKGASARKTGDGDYMAEFEFTAFDRPGEYQLEIGNRTVNLGSTPIVITKPR